MMDVLDVKTVVMMDVMMDVTMVVLVVMIVMGNYRHTVEHPRTTTVAVHGHHFRLYQPQLYELFHYQELLHLSSLILLTGPWSPMLPLHSSTTVVQQLTHHHPVLP